MLSASAGLIQFTPARRNVADRDHIRDFVARHPEDFRIEWLPGYAPELNPEEPCNNAVKLAMVNATPASVEELRTMARRNFDASDGSRICCTPSFVTSDSLLRKFCKPLYSPLRASTARPTDWTIAPV
jgi:hypothetical protein